MPSYLTHLTQSSATRQKIALFAAQRLLAEMRGSALPGNRGFGSITRLFAALSRLRLFWLFWLFRSEQNRAGESRLYCRNDCLFSPATGC